MALQEMERLHEKIKELNETLFNPVGLNILWPRKVGFLFVGIISPSLSRLGRLTDALVDVVSFIIFRLEMAYDSR